MYYGLLVLSAFTVIDRTAPVLFDWAVMVKSAKRIMDDCTFRPAKNSMTTLLSAFLLIPSRPTPQLWAAFHVVSGARV